MQYGKAESCRGRVVVTDCDADCSIGVGHGKDDAFFFHCGELEGVFLLLALAVFHCDGSGVLYSFLWGEGECAFALVLWGCG